MFLSSLNYCSPRKALSNFQQVVSVWWIHYIMISTGSYLAPEQFICQHQESIQHFWSCYGILKDVEGKSLLGWTNNVQIFPVLLSISEISTLFWSLARKTDQLATHTTSLVVMKKPAGYPAKPFGSDSLQALGIYRYTREGFKPVGSW